MFQIIQLGFKRLELLQSGLIKHFAMLKPLLE